MSFVGHLVGPCRTISDFWKSLRGLWGIAGDFCRSLGGSLGDN